MINQKYYDDVQKFEGQFATGIELTKDIKLEGDIKEVLICGMGGSAFYVDLINNLLASVGEKLEIKVQRGYDLPLWVDESTLVIVSSYSGNTEETISCYNQAKERELNVLVLASGGKLLDLAKANSDTYYQIPTGLQPRLSTGYYIAGIVNILTNNDIITSDKLINQLGVLKLNVEVDKAREMAKSLVGKVPVIYATHNIWSIARVSKIKFNENSKIQSFWNYIPELNHNEMVGYTKMIMDLKIMMFESKFAHERNKKRMHVMQKLMQDKGVAIEMVTPLGDSVVEEMFNIYNFVDYVTYFLAESYGVDPEPVSMVEDFKKMIG